MVRKLLFIVVTGSALLFAFPQMALADGPWTIATAATGSSSILGDTGGVERELAQTFKSPGAGTVSAFKVTFGANNGSPSGVVTWKLAADYLGSPGFVLATSTFTPTASADNTITLSSGPTLNKDGTYWLIFLAADQSTNVSWTMVTSAASTYADGARYISADREVTWSVQGSDQQLWLTINAVSATSTPEATSTPSNTATPTLTPTPTVTPSPAFIIIATYSATEMAGYPVVVEPSASFGEIAVTGLLIVLIGLLGVFFASWIWRRR